MSNLDYVTEAECKQEEGCGAILKIIRPREKDLGGFSVRRLVPVAGQQMIGPWIFFDHMGPATFPAGSGINVRPHPHINLATVTYLFEGEILHRDSVGSLQAIVPGDVNLMVAGSGIVHSERERPEVTAVEHSLHGLQLWLVLPEADEEIDPAFHHYPGAQIPVANVANVNVRVIIGSAYGVTSPVKQFAQTLYIEASLKAGQSLELPQAAERAIYVVSGEIQAKDRRIAQYEMAVLDADTVVTIHANEDCRVALIGGEAMSPRFIDWNFVSTRRERIEQAKADWQQGKFPKVPGDAQEFIPLP